MTTITNIPIKKLTLLEKNPRKITKGQFKKLCKSLDEDPEFFSVRPCLVNKAEISEGEYAYIVYAGNQRVLAAKKLRWDTVPCIVENDLSDELMGARIIKDNKHYGEFDFDILANEWDLEVLFDAGFSQLELSLGNDQAATEIEKPEKKDKSEKCAMCPKCGFEFESVGKGGKYLL